MKTTKTVDNCKRIFSVSQPSANLTCGFGQLEQADGFFGAEVGEIADRAAGVEGGALDFFDANVTAEIPEVEN